jgi:hypothetical protein
MSENFPENVFNHDVVMLWDKVSRFHVELSKSQSAPVSGMIQPDQIRLTSYIADLRACLTWVQAIPQLDMPETHPRPYKLEPFPPEVNVENESINVILRLVRAAAVELVNSQSARYASRLQPFDEARFTAIVDKIEAFLVNYIQGAATVPLDIPESSPEEGQITDGSVGVMGAGPYGSGLTNN